MEEVTTSRWTRSCMFCGFLTWIWYLSIWNPIGCLKLLLSGWTQVIPLTSSLSLFWSPAGQVDESLMSQLAKWEIISGNIINLSLFAVPRNGRLKMEISPLSHQCNNVTNVSPLAPPLSSLICSPQVKRLLSTLRAQVSNTDYVRKYNSTSPDHQPLGQVRCQSFHPQVKWILWYLKLPIEKFIIEKQSQQCVSDLYWVLFCHQFQHHGHTFYLTHWRLRVPIPSKTLEASC